MLCFIIITFIFNKSFNLIILLVILLFGNISSIISLLLTLKPWYLWKWLNWLTYVFTLSCYCAESIWDASIVDVIIIDLIRWKILILMSKNWILCFLLFQSNIKVWLWSFNILFNSFHRLLVLFMSQWSIIIIQTQLRQ